MQGSASTWVQPFIPRWGFGYWIDEVENTEFCQQEPNGDVNVS